MPTGREYVESPDPPAEIKLTAGPPQIERSGLAGGAIRVTLKFRPDVLDSRSEMRALEEAIKNATDHACDVSTDVELSTIALLGVREDNAPALAEGVKAALREWHQMRLAKWQEWQDAAPSRAAAQKSADDEITGIAGAFERALKEPDS
jgi:hypothetical protein